jgi:hypothetical protein
VDSSIRRKLSGLASISVGSVTVIAGFLSLGGGSA